ncbi:MAG: cytochrome c biogenesis protein CcsA [Bacteroidales bacterium]
MMMRFIRNNWWKILAVMLLAYVIVGGLLWEVPALPVVRQTIRNIYFHVGMWFSMMFILGLSLFYSIRYLRYFRVHDDLMAWVAVKTALVFGALGLVTGMLWAYNTWGSFWVNDPKLTGAAVGMLTYLAYLVLRSSVEEHDKRARLAAVYNIFAFVLFFVFIMILPRLAEASIHPGIDGNPALSSGDLDPRMQKVFFPAMVGWILLSLWIFRVYARLETLHRDIVEYKENRS